MWPGELLTQEMQNCNAGIGEEMWPGGEVASRFLDPCPWDCWNCSCGVFSGCSWGVPVGLFPLAHGITVQDAAVVFVGISWVSSGSIPW